MGEKEIYEHTERVETESGYVQITVEVEGGDAETTARGTARHAKDYLEP